MKYKYCLQHRRVQAYAKPPALVELTLSGVMTVLQKTPTWDEAKKQLGDASFMEKLLKFDKDKLNDALLKKLQKFTTNPEFTPEVTCMFSNCNAAVHCRIASVSMRQAMTGSAPSASTSIQHFTIRCADTSSLSC